MSVIGFTGIGKGRQVVSVDHDPTYTPTNVPKGSLIIDEDGKVYRKTDDGPTTNVVSIGEHKDTLDATCEPTANHDSTAGYSKGSRIFDLTTGKEYVCRSAKAESAVWNEINKKGDVYVDRGDPSKPDFSVSRGLTADGAWHALELSSIVPVGAASKLVHLRCRIRDSGSSATMALRTAGKKHTVNAHKQISREGSDSRYFEAWILMNAKRCIEYCLDSLLTTMTEITVAGWMI